MVPGCWTLLVKGYCPSLVMMMMDTLPICWVHACIWAPQIIFSSCFMLIIFLPLVFVCFYLILPSLSLRPWLVSAVFPTCMYPFPESPPVLCFIFHIVVRFLALLSLTFLSMFVVFGMVPCHHSDFGLSFWFSGTGSVKACLKFIPVSRILHFCP